MTRPGAFNVPEAPQKDGREDNKCADSASSVNGILQERGADVWNTFHSDGGAEEDHLEDKDVYVDLGEDLEEDLKKALRDLVEDALQNGISDQSAERLSHMLERYPVFGFGWENPYQPTSHQWESASSKGIVQVA